MKEANDNSMTAGTVWGVIAEALRSEIAGGARPPGDRLPTEGQLAARFGVNRHTVRRALAALVALMACGQLLVATGLVPLRAELYAYARPAGEALGAVIRADPAPVWFSSVVGDHNIMLYTGEPIREVPLERADRIPPPAWIITTPEAVPALRRRLADLPEMPAAEAIGRRGQPFWLMRLPAGESASAVVEP